MQDPQIQLTDLGIAIPDMVDPKRPAVLDAAHRSFVNYETFFFADEAGKREFDMAPTTSCGILTDPVTKERFRPGTDAPRREFNRRTYFFLSAANAEAFARNPEAMARPNYDMIEVPGMPAAR